MIKQKADYKLQVNKVTKVMSRTPEELTRWVDISERYIEAVENLTKEELALVEAYLQQNKAAMDGGFERVEKGGAELTWVIRN